RRAPRIPRVSQAAARDRRANRRHAARGARRAPVHLPDAERRAGGDGRDRQVGSRQRRDPRRPDPGAGRSGPRQAPGRLPAKPRRRSGRACAPGRRADEETDAPDVTAPRTRVVRVDAAMPDRTALGEAALVLGARPGVPEEVTAGTRTVGVRLSPHPVALGLVRALRAPVTAPSANPSGLEPPTTASAVLAYFRDAIDLVVDGGATAGGEPSTVLDTTVDPPRVLRQGAVSV